MLRKIRITLALLCFTLLTLLFLDFTGCIQTWFGWMARIQFLPAVLALNVGVVLFLVLLTLLLGRVYCSVICPLGVFQDVVSWISGRRKKKKYRFSYAPARTALRWGVMAVFVLAMLTGFGALASLIAPYSAYGRMAANLLAPLYRWGNNGLAYLAERADSYAFYEVDVWLKSISSFAIAVVTFIVLAVLAWRGGRVYCNTICPVGTLLGALSRFSFFRPVIDSAKCNHCGLCSRKCKASCIDGEKHRIDYSRCVACMDCLETCRHGAIRYVSRRQMKAQTLSGETVKPAVNREGETNRGRRDFLAVGAMMVAGAAVRAQEKTVDGGLAVIEDKVIPERATPLYPAGSLSARNVQNRCTGCQLCVAACPNGVLRPSGKLEMLMKPEMSYERGYCRPECTRCSDVCPAGAIRPVTREEKSSIQIGHAVWVKKNCIPLTDGVECGNCARHCPSGAIQMVSSDPTSEDAPKIPAVNTARCIGCGACENLCPARPFSAIYVEGHAVHKMI